MNTIDAMHSPRSAFQTLADFEQHSLAHEAGAPEDIEAHTQWRAIAFRLGEHRLLISIADMTELLPMPTLTRVPGSRDWVLGVANVRGNLVSVIDLNQYLGEPRTALTKRSRLLLSQQPRVALGLLVDEVLGQRSLSQEQLANLGEEPDEQLRPYVAGTVELDGRSWTVFKISNLVAASQFQQAAA